MEYMRFPSKLTEEEKMLQAKYAVLKKKKKVLQSLKLPQTEQEKIPAPKASTEPKLTTKVVKKMVQMGVLPSFARKASHSEHTGFKRSITLERKLNATKISFDGFEHSSDMQPRPRLQNKRKNVYKPSISVHDWEEEDETAVPKIPRIETNTIYNGNTIKVKGHNISEDYLKRSFQTCGRIVNVAMDEENQCGFVTFDKVEAANRAVTEINGCMASGIQLKVSFAKEHSLSWSSRGTSFTDWSSINADNSSDENHDDNRNMLVYENNLFE
ncbi:Negative elongation factor E [Gryllus bimaculatus]|nr:Negative elongation factor E [Gryllus bimaculatus]